MQNSEEVEVTAEVIGSGSLDGAGSEDSETLESAGASATFEGDHGEEFEVRILAVADSGDDESVVLDQVVHL